VATEKQKLIISEQQALDLHANLISRIVVLQQFPAQNADIQNCIERENQVVEAMCLIFLQIKE
jgi:hypothetical protein